MFTSSCFLSNDVTVSVKNSLLFFFTQAVKAVKTVMKVIFSLVEIKHKNVIAETQLEFDDKDIALSGNVDGIANSQTFTIPETQKT